MVVREGTMKVHCATGCQSRYHSAGREGGTNDPCPCGSGLKFKNCHVGNTGEASSRDSLWNDLHRLTNRLPSDLLRFATRRYGPSLVDEAWSEFTLFTEEAFNPESLHLPVFIPWFLHEWTPDPVATIVPKPDLDAFPLGSEYLRRRGRYDDRLTIRYLESCRDSAFSFLDVVDVTPGSGCIMHDVLTGWKGEAIEKSGSQTLRKGEILFASRDR